MATRPVFVPSDAEPGWEEHLVAFEWFPGFAPSQKQKSISSLHACAEDQFSISNPLEISTRSMNPLGVRLSAFNLVLKIPQFGAIPLESAFQGSKVFHHSGKLEEAYEMSAKEAKAAANAVNRSDQLVRFEFDDSKWPLEPKSWFYDWLYIRAFGELNTDVKKHITEFDAFTDIEFNPKKSFSCQARSCAIAASLIRHGTLERAIRDPNYLREIAYPVPEELDQKALGI